MRSTSAVRWQKSPASSGLIPIHLLSFVNQRREKKEEITNEGVRNKQNSLLLCPTSFVAGGVRAPTGHSASTDDISRYRLRSNSVPTSPDAGKPACWSSLDRVRCG